MGKCFPDGGTACYDTDGSEDSVGNGDDADVKKFNDAIPVFQFVTAKMDDMVK